MSKDGVKPAEESDSKTGEKRKQSGVNKVSLNKEPEHVEVPREVLNICLSAVKDACAGLMLAHLVINCPTSWVYTDGVKLLVSVCRRTGVCFLHLLKKKLGCGPQI
jgi:hypothetical protein